MRFYACLKKYLLKYAKHLNVIYKLGGERFTISTRMIE